jgi:hypothetical protein
MSNYTKLTAYDTKDSLSTGDPLKRIKGTELDDEFDAIAIAIATKSNLASPEFSGVPTTPTAASGVNTTQIATTAFVQTAIALVYQTLYPVGSIYTNASSATNPATLLGFGTWAAFAAGRVMVGNGGGFSAGATGGSADASVVSHTHTFSATTGTESATHAHATGNSGNFITGSGSTGIAGYQAGGNFTFASSVSTTGTQSANHTHSVSGTTASAGSSGTNANLQPYIVVYMWQRTA